MAKEKKKNGIPNKHLHARVLYLQQIATHLVTAAEKTPSNPGKPGHDILVIGDESPADGSTTQTANPEDTKPLPEGNKLGTRRTGSARLASHLTQISRRAQIHLPHEVKHQICKRCSTVLVEDSTCKKHTENLSKGGRKAHADVFVIECVTCGAIKRFPVGAKRQLKKSKRQSKAERTDP